MKTYLLHVAIGFDTFVQRFFRFGTFGITISSRAGTAMAHAKPWGHPNYWRHAWGVWLYWFLEKTPWLGFGPGHCQSAICNDILRARAAIMELTDPIVVKFYARTKDAK